MGLDRLEWRQPFGGALIGLGEHQVVCPQHNFEEQRLEDRGGVMGGLGEIGGEAKGRAGRPLTMLGAPLGVRRQGRGQIEQAQVVEFGLGRAVEVGPGVGRSRFLDEIFARQSR